MRTYLLLLTALFFIAGVAHANSKIPPADLKMVGQAELKVLWFKIYQARLETPDGFYSEDRPQLLTLRYQRDISNKDLIEETERQWKKAGISRDEFQVWIEQLERLWPDIRKDDSLAFYKDRDGTGHFYFNGTAIGSISDSYFSSAFLNIWLSDQSDFPDLTRKLKGLGPDK